MKKSLKRIVAAALALMLIMGIQMAVFAADDTSSSSDSSSSSEAASSSEATSSEATSSEATSSEATSSAADETMPAEDEPTSETPVLTSESNPSTGAETTMLTVCLVAMGVSLAGISVLSRRGKSKA